MTFAAIYLNERRLTPDDFTISGYQEWREAKLNEFRSELHIAADHSLTEAEYRDFRAWMLGKAEATA